MDCRVVVEAAVPVYDVATPEEAVRIAVSKTGKMLNPDLSYVEVDAGSRTGPDGTELPPAFVVADEALVALELRMDVFDVESEQHAERVARKEIGSRLTDIPLEVTETREVVESDGEQEAPDPASEGDASASADQPGDSAGDATGGNASDEDDELLPEFEEMVEDQRE